MHFLRNFDSVFCSCLCPSNSLQEIYMFQCTFLAYVLVCSLFCKALDTAPAQIVDVDNFPKFEMGDRVDFFFIEGAFPFTTPLYIREKMGEIWNQYSLSHAGLGIWNKDTGVKYSLEMVCSNYTGAPSVTLPSYFKQGIT